MVSRTLLWLFLSSLLLGGGPVTWATREDWGLQCPPPMDTLAHEYPPPPCPPPKAPPKPLDHVDMTEAVAVQGQEEPAEEETTEEETTEEETTEEETAEEETIEEETIEEETTEEETTEEETEEEPPAETEEEPPAAETEEEPPAETEEEPPAADTEEEPPAADTEEEPPAADTEEEPPAAETEEEPPIVTVGEIAGGAEVAETTAEPGTTEPPITSIDSDNSQNGEETETEPRDDMMADEPTSESEPDVGGGAIEDTPKGQPEGEEEEPTSESEAEVGGGSIGDTPENELEGEGPGEEETSESEAEVGGGSIGDTPEVEPGEDTGEEETTSESEAEVGGGSIGDTPEFEPEGEDNGEEETTSESEAEVGGGSIGDTPEIEPEGEDNGEEESEPEVGGGSIGDTPEVEPEEEDPGEEESEPEVGGGAIGDTPENEGGEVGGGPGDIVGEATTVSDEPLTTEAERSTNGEAGESASTGADSASTARDSASTANLDLTTALLVEESVDVTTEPDSTTLHIQENVDQTTQADSTSAPQTEADVEVTTEPLAEISEMTSESEATTNPQPETSHVTTQSVVAKAGDTAYIVAPGDPCGEAEKVQDDRRHFSSKLDKKNPIDDHVIVEGWYMYEYKGNPAMIVTQAIKPRHCGTSITYHINLQGDVLPGEGNETTADLCGTIDSKYGADGFLTCVEPLRVQVKNCGPFYMYQLSTVGKGAKAATGICIQDPNEVIPDEYLAVEEVEEPRLLPVVPPEEVSRSQGEGVVTVEFNFTKDEYKDEGFIDEDQALREAIARKLNEMKPPPMTTTTPAPTTTTTAAPVNPPDPNTKAPSGGGTPTDNQQIGPVVPDIDPDADLKGPGLAARKKREVDDTPKNYTADDVFYVGDTPRKQGDTLQAAVFVKKEDGEGVDQDRLYDAMTALNETGELDSAAALPVTDIYKGLPNDIVVTAMKPSSKEIWNRHKGLFILLIVLVLLVLLILLIACCCLRCRHSRGSWTRDPLYYDEKPTLDTEKGKKHHYPPVKHAVESPFPDEEITRGEVPALQKAPPARNGSGRHPPLNKQESEGYVVPMEEMLMKKNMEVEDTKL